MRHDPKSKKKKKNKAIKLNKDSKRSCKRGEAGRGEGTPGKVRKSVYVKCVNPRS